MQEEAEGLWGSAVPRPGGAVLGWGWSGVSGYRHLPAVSVWPRLSWLLPGPAPSSGADRAGGESPWMGREQGGCHCCCSLLLLLLRGGGTNSSSPHTPQGKLLLLLLFFPKLILVLIEKGAGKEEQL